MVSMASMSVSKTDGPGSSPGAPAKMLIDIWENIIARDSIN